MHTATMKTRKLLNPQFVACLLFVFLAGHAQLLAQEPVFKNASGYTNAAKKAYQNGQHIQAVVSLIKALRKKPDYDKAHELLEVAYPAAERTFEVKISELESRGAEFTGEQTVQTREQLVKGYRYFIELQTELQSLPPLIGKKSKRELQLTYTDYQDKLFVAERGLQEARRQTAEQLYQQGKRLMAKGGIDNHKAAAKAFKRTQEFVPAYKDAMAMYASNREAATMRVAIIPFENKSHKMQYGAIGEKVTDDLIGMLVNNRSAMEFVEIINRDQLQRLLQEQNLSASGVVDQQSAVEMGKVLGIHRIITGQITQIISNENDITSKQYTQQAQAVVDQEVYTDSQGKRRVRDVMGTVYAKVTEYNQQAYAKISGSYKIIDVQTARLLSGNSFEETYTYDYSWARFSGDERALSSEVLVLTSRDQKAPPIDEERVNQAARMLSATLARQIGTYLK